MTRKPLKPRRSMPGLSRCQRCGVLERNEFLHLVPGVKDGSRRLVCDDCHEYLDGVDTTLASGRYDEDDLFNDQQDW